MSKKGKIKSNKCSVSGCEKNGVKSKFGILCEKHLIEFLEIRECSYENCKLPVMDGSNFCNYHLEINLNQGRNETDEAMSAG